MTNTFEPRDHLILLERANRKTGVVTKTEYLQVQWRVVWFRKENPNGKIISKPVHIDVDKGVAIFETLVETESGAVAQAHGSETVADWKDFIEKAQSKSVGRALALLGYGTQFAGPELDEGTERIVDTPVETKSTRLDDIPTVSQLKERCKRMQLKGHKTGKVLEFADIVRLALKELYTSDEALTPDKCAAIALYLDQASHRQHSA